MKKENITFIGAGIATAYALLRITQILTEQPINIPFRVRIIDKSPDFFAGIPYGDRSGKAVLLINALNNFLPPDERLLFVQWLDERKESLLDEFLEHGGEQAKIWVENNRPFIDSNNWNELYIPRFFFGRFIREKTVSELSRCENAGLIEMTYTNGEVLDVNKETNLFKVILKNEISIYSENIVLSIGSLPTRKIFKEELIIKGHGYLVLNDIYNKNLSFNIGLIKEFLRSRNGKATNVLVIGANASGLETLYSFVDHIDLNDKITSYTVLSSHGLMPDSDIDYEKERTLSQNL
ncbi:FAD/NAD(P)-binding protein [Maribacter aestuarii]|uniref:FAD/NAD(P)-binding protein n=1 Tax=Maribacter aestuarii TaxID=1130723 RepID=UPI00248B5748|nr:FAD/NAD(P)-binding protein [Maribacter aestuarii]